MILILDTETTGLAPLNQRGKGYKDPKFFLDWNDCRAVQIAWMICDDSGNTVKTQNFIIKPKYFIIPDESTAIHGISQEEAKLKGIKIEKVLEELISDLTKCDLLVGHNINFDYHVILAEMYRCNLINDTYNTVQKYCTMVNGSKADEKWFKLHELYKKYFNKDPEKALHRANNDVEICKEIYFHQKDI